MTEPLYYGLTKTEVGRIEATNEINQNIDCRLCTAFPATWLIYMWIILADFIHYFLSICYSDICPPQWAPCLQRVGVGGCLCSLIKLIFFWIIKILMRYHCQVQYIFAICSVIWYNNQFRWSISFLVNILQFVLASFSPVPGTKTNTTVSVRWHTWPGKYPVC